MKQQPLVCPHCGTQNRPDAKFCRRCSKPLTADRSEADSQAAPAALREPKVTARLPAQSAQPASDGGSRTNLPAPGKPGSPRDGKTTRLLPTGFDSLPEGAVVHGGKGRYEIVRVVLPAPELNIYQAVEDNSSRAEWVLFESAKPARFHPERDFAGLGLTHPGLVRIKEAFEEAPYEDQPRGYLVSESPQVPLTGVQQVGDYQIANWGAQLADALAYLHERNLFLGGIAGSSLVLVNQQAKFTDLGMAHALAHPGSPEASAALAQDIHDLVMVLSAIASQAKQGAPLAPPLAAVFQRELISSKRYPTARDLQAALRTAADQIVHPSKARLSFEAASDVGRKREINEDSVLAQDLTPASRSVGQPIALLLVADGLGGAAAGEVASKLAVETIAREVTAALTARPVTNAAELDWGALIKGAVERTNRVIGAARQQARNDMGTTLVGALVVGYLAYVVNVGDSRAYLVTRDRIERISHDHSLVQSLVDSHQIREEDVRSHPQRNLIFRNLGDRPNVEVDLFPTQLEPGQWLLFCSDGLWEMTQDADLQRIVTTAANPKQACTTLIELANRNGGEDNITTIVAQIEAAA